MKNFSNCLSVEILPTVTLACEISLTVLVFESCRRHFVGRNRAKVAISVGSDLDLDLSHLRTPDRYVAPVPVRDFVVVAAAGVDDVSLHRSREPPLPRLLFRQDIIPYSQMRTEILNQFKLNRLNLRHLIIKERTILILICI